MKANPENKNFDRLIAENQELILKVCYLFFNNKSDREDLFQEIIIKLWKGLSSFRGDSKITTWIYRVSLNTAISSQRRKKRRDFIFPDKLPEIPIVDKLHEDENDFRKRAFYFGISRLRPIEKSIILLYLEERTYKEISDITGISVKNVSVRIVRIKTKLEKIIEPVVKKNIENEKVRF